MRALVIIAFCLFAAGCYGNSEPVNEPEVTQYASVAARVAALAGREALNYSIPGYWGCAGGEIEGGDICRVTLNNSSIATDGTVTPVEWKPSNEAVADCFYIYPTVDATPRTQNHDEMNDLLFPRGVIALQAAPFAQACRVFAPFYRQATIGTYTDHPDKAIPVFLRAFADVTAAFEHYLRKWNDGRPIIILGHSQGAMMANYLLHSYFDGVSAVTQIDGSRTSEELRARLVAAFPIGYNAFTPEGKLTGGSFTDLPLCESTEQSGCVTAYLTFPEGFSFSYRETVGAEFDAVMAGLGFINRVQGEGDSLACVNPAAGPPVAPSAATDENEQPVADGDIRLLTGSWQGFVNKLYPGRYTATCRNYDPLGNYLAIARHQADRVLDTRGDPLGATSPAAKLPLGLHTSDYWFPMGDLVELVRRKTLTYKNGK